LPPKTSLAAVLGAVCGKQLAAVCSGPRAPSAMSECQLYVKYAPARQPDSS
jgi:hypothetical protein